MNQTIRDYLKRRVRWTYGIGFGAWLVMPLSAMAGIKNPAVFLFAFVPFIGALIAMLWIKCPRCSARLTQSIAGALALPLFKPQPNFCPYCGVSLDEPRFKPLSHALEAPYNPIR